MKIVIAGAGAVGIHLATLLSGEENSCVLIDEDEDRLENLPSECDVMKMCLSPTSIDALKEAGTKGCDLFVAVTTEETKNMTCCTLAKGIGAKKTVARIDNYEYLNPEYKDFFKDIGIDSLIYPEVLAAKDIINGLKMSWV